MRHGIITAVFVLGVLGTGQALADDSLPAGTGGFAGVDVPVADDDYSLWSDLRALFSDTTVSIGATPRSDEAAVAGDPGYNAYARIDIDGFTVGGRFARWSESAASPDVDQRSYGIGASYRLNSWTVGIDWSRGDYDEVFLDVGSGEDSDVIAFTSSYALRPGVKVSGLLEYSEDEPAQVRAAPGAFTVGIGTLINF